MRAQWQYKIKAEGWMWNGENRFASTIWNSKGKLNYAVDEVGLTYTQTRKCIHERNTSVIAQRTQKHLEAQWRHQQKDTTDSSCNVHMPKNKNQNT